MKALLPVLMIALTFSLASCKDSPSASAAAVEAKFSSNLSAEENAALDKQIMAMFRHSITSTEITETNGCKMSFKDQVSTLKEGVQSVSYRKILSNSASKECGTVEINAERSVEVTDPDTCVREYERLGNIVRMKACSDDIITINMSTKSGTAKISGEATQTISIQAITINKAELTRELSNVTIIYKGSDANGDEIELSREVGNAIEILDLKI